VNKKTIDILNELNKKFYDETGSIVWNQSPNYYWEGWYQLSKIIKENKSTNHNYKILDLGCGNARFSNFLRSELDQITLSQIEYLGVDFSVNFMNRSQPNEGNQLANYNLKEVDILKDLDTLETCKFDLIVMFGLIHHIPSLLFRKQFFKDVKRLLNPNGLIIFTTWRYLDSPRLLKRVVDPDTEKGIEIFDKLDIKKSDLEDGDNILDWVKKIFCLRYSHHFSELEIDCYIKDNQLGLIHSFVYDGRDSKRNKYYICRNKNKSA
jgi:tRNA (uracil-5-)-methyltransferase TRM9